MKHWDVQQSALGFTTAPVSSPSKSQPSPPPPLSPTKHCSLPPRSLSYILQFTTTAPPPPPLSFSHLKKLPQDFEVSARFPEISFALLTFVPTSGFHNNWLKERRERKENKEDTLRTDKRPREERERMEQRKR